MDKAATILDRARKIVIPVLQVAGLTAAFIVLGLCTRDWFRTRIQEIHTAQDTAQKEKQKPANNPQAVALEKIAANLQPLGGQHANGDQVNGTSPGPGNSGSGSSSTSGKGKSVNGSGSNSSVGTGGTPPAQNTASPATQKPSFADAQLSVQEGWTGTWLFFVLVLGAAAIASVVLGKKPKRDVQDTQVFTNALEVWHPLIMTDGARNTPRRAKRFQNRVRYLAMRQRALQQKPLLSLGAWLLRWWYGVREETQTLLVPLTRDSSPSPADKEEIERLQELLERGEAGETASWTVKPGDAGSPLKPKRSTESQEDGKLSRSEEEFQARVLDTVFVPEEILVAFAALEEHDPAWIQDEGEFNARVASDTRSPEGEADQILQDAKDKGDWNHWRNDFRYYRRAYLKLCSEISKTAGQPPDPPPTRSRVQGQAAGAS